MNIRNIIDIDSVKQNMGKYKQGLVSRGINSDKIDELVELYDIWTEKLKKWEELRHRRNELAAKGEFSEEGKELKNSIRVAEEENYRAWRGYQELALQIPNIPLNDVPVGGESENKVIKQVNVTKEFNFSPKDHVEIGERLDIIDIPRASKVSGTRFVYLKNRGVLLEFALIQFVLNNLIKEGYSPIIPPALIKQEITEDLGYWHGGGNENYYLVHNVEIEGDEKGKVLPLYLIGTGEHSVVPMHSDEVFNECELPKKYIAFSSCFRREAGSYGQDTRGIIRLHQFDKLEMVSFVKPEDDQKGRDEMLSIVESMLKQLDLPYQVTKLATRDLGFPSAETTDVEVHMPGQARYRETHSISTTTDFQSRRLNIKYNTDSGEKKFAHILNGTALAIGRIIVAILENNQQEDGSVIIPEVLRPYTNFDTISPAA